jgi:hypothetical protein
LGALLSAWAGARLRAAWQWVRQHYALPAALADFGVALLALWLLSLLSPENRFLQTGDWQPLTGWLEFAYSPVAQRFFEALTAALGAFTLAAFIALLFSGWIRFAAAAVFAIFSAAIRSGLCLWLYHDPGLWLTPGIGAGLCIGGIGTLAILAASFFLPPQKLSGLAFCCLAAWFLSVNLAPAYPYPMPEKAALLHFNSLTRALAAFWPVAAGFYFFLASRNRQDGGDNA